MGSAFYILNCQYSGLNYVLVIGCVIVNGCLAHVYANKYVLKVKLINSSRVCIAVSCSYFHSVYKITSFVDDVSHIFFPHISVFILSLSVFFFFFKVMFSGQ